MRRVEQEKKTRNVVNYHFSTTTETSPQIEHLVQTEYQEADMGT